MRSPALGTPTITLPDAAANPYLALEEYLNEHQPEGSGLVLRCAPRGEELLVLIEHAITLQPPIKETFARVKAQLEATPAEVWTQHPEFGEPPQQLRVSFFICVLAQRQPYGSGEEVVVPLSQQANLELLEEDLLESDRVSEAAATGQPSLPTIANVVGGASSLQGLMQDPSSDSLLGDADFSAELAKGRPAEGPAEIALDPEVAAAFSPEHLRLVPLPEEEGSHSAYPPSPQEEGEHEYGGDYDDSDDSNYGNDEEEAPIEEGPLHIPRSIWAAGIGLCLLTFGSSFYVASRPCWFRSCPPLASAQSQVEEASSMLQAATTWDDLESARQELNGALRQLRAVPGWTSYGEQAQGLRSRYRGLLKSLAPIQDALKQADLAQEKSGAGQLKIKQWQEVLVHWEAAIAQLRGVSADSPLYALARDKLTQYEASLETASRRLAEEQEAQQLLSEARSLASDIPNRNDGLEMLEFLQRTQIKLQDALFTLRKVPRGTTAYAEAVRLMSRYESELSLNQGQQSKEEFIIDRYRDALSRAESAKVAEANGRWPDARDHWDAAIASMNQVPSSSSYYAEAQGLISEYAYALQKAEKEAEQYLALQDIEAELNEICEGSPQVCQHSVTPQLLKVTLTLEYERAILTAGSVGDEDSRISALNHVHSLETALEKISNQAQIPLELYDPDGVLVGMHQPRGSLNSI